MTIRSLQFWAMWRSHLLSTGSPSLCNLSRKCTRKCMGFMKRLSPKYCNFDTKKIFKLISYKDGVIITSTLKQEIFLANHQKTATSEHLWSSF